MPTHRHLPIPSSLILAVAAEVDEANRLGGLVPIWAVRAFATQRLGCGSGEFDSRLVEMERAGEVDLKAANDPRTPEAKAGIESARGRLAWIVVR